MMSMNDSQFHHRLLKNHPHTMSLFVGLAPFTKGRPLGSLIQRVSLAHHVARQRNSLHADRSAVRPPHGSPVAKALSFRRTHLHLNALVGWMCPLDPFVLLAQSFPRGSRWICSFFFLVNPFCSLLCCSSFLWGTLLEQNSGNHGSIIQPPCRI